MVFVESGSVFVESGSVFVESGLVFVESGSTPGRDVLVATFVYYIIMIDDEETVQGIDLTDLCMMCKPSVCVLTKHYGNIHLGLAYFKPGYSAMFFHRSYVRHFRYRDEKRAAVRL